MLRITNQEQSKIERHINSTVEKHIHHDAPVVDLSPIHDRLEKAEHNQLAAEMKHHQKNIELLELLEVQGNALIEMRHKHNIARQNRYLLIKKLKREQKKNQKQLLILKIAIGISLIVAMHGR